MPFTPPSTFGTAEYTVSFSPDSSLYFDGTIGGTLTRIPGGGYSATEAQADEIFQRIVDALAEVLGPELVSATKKTGVVLGEVTPTPEP